ncbi:MAG: tetratricopeptide repeat protein [Chitinophagaceae bacterium]|nr:MAG: tetratricopeptide repeat protein [Chitinophagaceae bacterium]
MAEVKSARPHTTESEAVVDRAKDVWSRFGKTISIVLGAIILVVGGILVYNNFVVGPKEKKASDAIFRAQEYYAQDSLDKALNGDAQYPGFEKIVSQYGGTKAGELARFYAGSIHLKKGAFDKAISHLKEFDTDAPQVQARAYKLLGDAYAEQGKSKEAVEQYKKAANTFPEDEASASEALFLAAYLYDRVLNDKAQATELYKKIKTDYNQTQWSFEADKYLAQAGVYSVE